MSGQKNRIGSPRELIVPLILCYWAGGQSRSLVSRSTKSFYRLFMFETLEHTLSQLT